MPKELHIGDISGCLEIIGDFAEPVNVLPQPKAGGSLATQAFKESCSSFEIG